MQMPVKFCQFDKILVCTLVLTSALDYTLPMHTKIVSVQQNFNTCILKFVAWTEFHLQLYACDNLKHLGYCTSRVNRIMLIMNLVQALYYAFCVGCLTSIFNLSSVRIIFFLFHIHIQERCFLAQFPQHLVKIRSGNPGNRFFPQNKEKYDVLS